MPAATEMSRTDCKEDLEQFCSNQVLTYGGYCDSIVVDEAFVLRIPANLSLAGAAPLLCAGITTYSSMRHWGFAKGKNIVTPQSSA